MHGRCRHFTAFIGVSHRRVRCVERRGFWARVQVQWVDLEQASLYSVSVISGKKYRGISSQALR
jgi:hypothetical protein